MKQLNKEKEKGMKKKFIELFKNDNKEIDEEFNQVVLKELDTINYAFDNDKPVSKEDIEKLKILLDARNNQKKTVWELVKTIAQIFGITISGAVALVGMVYTVKGYNFDCEWMKKIWDNKDSVNVIDNPSRTNLAKRRDNTRKAIDHLRNMKMDIR